jgi:hypothetical protein
VFEDRDGHLWFATSEVQNGMTDMNGLCTNHLVVRLVFRMF